MKKKAKVEAKYIFPLICLLVAICVGIIYLFVTGIIDSNPDTSYGVLIRTSSGLKHQVELYSTFFWITTLIGYTIYIVAKGIKQKVKFTFKELKTYTQEVLMGFVGAWFFTLLMLVSAFSSYNQSFKEVIKTETIYITAIKSRVKHHGGNRGSSAKTYYYISTNSKNKAFKKITTSSLFYGSLREGVPLVVNSYRGRLNYSFSEVKIPKRYINKDLINLRGKALQGFLNQKAIPVYVLWFALMAILWLFIFLLIASPSYKEKAKLTYKILLVLGLFPLPFELYFYFFSYNTFTATIILAAFWMSMVLSALPGSILVKQILPLIIKFQAKKRGVLIYYISVCIIFLSLLAGLFIYLIYFIAKLRNIELF
ncbi:hypothetical protein [Microscilla marina]|uniref:Membrane protein, putative n=1 Tax=Microscilla marina ATCC 23134 TaxID=313606 RepID=A1ZGB1_MICM2|nr:hypothetical protein [Microscilla marina]EAY30528.1 membrane protein, putative [Microscilla marina ATCC 23134]